MNRETRHKELMYAFFPNVKNKKLVLVSVSLFFVLIAIYTQLVMGKGTVYTHFFYLPIILTGIWFYDHVTGVGLFFGTLHIILGFIHNASISLEIWLRFLMMLVFAHILKYLGSVIAKKNNEIRMEKDASDNLIRSIGDGVIAVDIRKKVIAINKVAEELTGWASEDALGKEVQEVFRITHEKEGGFIINPIDEVLKTGEIQYMSNHAVLISKNGQKYNVEDSASPIRDIEGSLAGVVLVFRDVTERKKHSEQIRYLSYHDSLTGLYNRRFFEEEINRIDLEENYPLSIMIGDLNNLKLTNDAFGHLAGDKVIIKAAEIIRKNCRKDDIIARWGGDEFVVLMPRTSPAEVELIANRISCVCEETVVKSGTLSIAFGWDSKYETTENVNYIFKNAESYMYKNKIYNSPSVRGKTFKMILEALFEKSPREREHSERVSEHCFKIADVLGLTKHKKETLRTIGLLHDIGKIIIPDHVLEKKSDLTRDEWAEMKTHPVIGYRIISSSEDMSDVALGILSHHERWDGQGYPKGLRREQIPLSARIVAVADAYDAMISNRPYHNAVDEQQAVEEIVKNSGIQFDPDVARAFVEGVLNTSFRIIKDA